MARDDVFLILIPQVAISLLSWVQIVLSINRFDGVLEIGRINLWGLLLFLYTAFLRWIATLALRTELFHFQWLAALLAATIAWVGFVVIFNGDFFIPTRQQALSLLASLAITMLWEVNNRMLIQL